MVKTKSNKSINSMAKTKTSKKTSKKSSTMKNMYSNFDESDNMMDIEDIELTKSKSKSSKKFSNKNMYTPEKIIILCLEMLNIVKLYHWKTLKYSEHKATDELYDELNDKIDEFVETFIGKTGKRINLTNIKNMRLIDFNNVDDFKKLIENSKTYLINMSNSPIFSIENSDLLNIRDEILGILNKFTYLLTLK
jgi:hypothetical protein